MSNKILDAAGRELIYWPLGAVKAGENSATLDIQVLCGSGELLACESSPNGTVFAKQGSDAYRDLNITPYDLTPFGTGYHTFTIYFHADSAVADWIRLPLSVGFASHSPAQWFG